MPQEQRTFQTTFIELTTILFVECLRQDNVTKFI